jgi:hypothetical protein
MSAANYNIPFEYVNARCFVLDPVINESQAYAQAGQYQGNVFDSTVQQVVNRFRREKPKIEAQLLHRRLVPFWHVRCSSHFDYSRLNEYQIFANNPEAVQITVRDGHEQSITYRVDATGRSGGVVNLRGIERVVSDRQHETWEDSYIQNPDMLPAQYELEQKRMQGYIVQNPRPVTNVEELATDVRVDGKPLFDDEIETIIVPPLETAETIVQRALSNVMVSMEGPTINEAKLQLERLDLYFRPIFVFEFERFDRDGNRTDRKVEELDALARNRWTTLERTEFQMTQIPWKKILRLSADIGAILVQNYTGIGPALEITSTLLQQGGNIIDDLTD